MFLSYCNTRSFCFIESRIVHLYVQHRDSADYSRNVTSIDTYLVYSYSRNVTSIDTYLVYSYSIFTLLHHKSYSYHGKSFASYHVVLKSHHTLRPTTSSRVSPVMLCRKAARADMSHSARVSANTTTRSPGERPSSRRPRPNQAARSPNSV